VRYSYFAPHLVLSESIKNVHRQVINNACLRGERRQGLLAEAGRMVGVGRWRSTLRVSDAFSLIALRRIPQRSARDMTAPLAHHILDNSRP
jgi:hypothetical protein